VALGSRLFRSNELDTYSFLLSEIRSMASLVLVTLVLVWLGNSATQVRFAEAPMKASWPQWCGAQRDGQIAAADWPPSLTEQHLAGMWSVPLVQTRVI
jgi:hypothetical protein